MKLTEHFKNPPKEYSPVPFWFLNGELEPERLAWQMDEMLDKGIYGAFMHARAYLKTPYLEKEWWAAISSCVEHGKEQGFHTWLYDEYAWPSGTAGSVFEYGFQKRSRILSEGEENMAKGLWIKTYGLGQQEQLDEDIGQFGTPIGIYGRGQENSHTYLHREEWRGEKEIMVFYRKIYRDFVDYMNKGTIARFIQYTHEEYRTRYGEDFGGEIPGIFFDEIYMIGFPLPWTDCLLEEFRDRCGYDLLERLPYLLGGEGSQERRVRADYFQIVGQLYEEAFFKQISDWCEQYHLKLTGHTEEFLREHPRRQGDYFKTMRHLQIPGADNHDYRYRFPRKITLCEPKYAVSTARAYGKERAMSEAMGGAGWGCSLQEFKRGVNTMGAMGIGMFVLHGFYYECEHQGSQADWPASFFYQNPYWKYFKLFADYISRVCLINSTGIPVVDTGLYYPIEDMQKCTLNGSLNPVGEEISREFHNALNILLKSQHDTDMINEECILKAEITKDGKLKVGQQEFRCLVIPVLSELSAAMADKLEVFSESGGKVVYYYGQMKMNQKDRLSGSFLCHTRKLPLVLDSLFTQDIRVTEGRQRDFFASHRRIDGSDVYFLSNSSREAGGWTLQLRGGSCKGIRRMNLETGEMMTISSQAVVDGVLVKLRLGEDEACCLILEKESTIAEYVPETEAAADSAAESWDCGEEMTEIVAGRWKVLPLEREYDHVWGIDAGETELEIPVAVFHSTLQDKAEQIRICNTEWEEGRCGRHLTPWKAAWITRRVCWHDELDIKDLYFRKSISLITEPEEVKACIACIHHCELYINGVHVTAQNSGGKPFTVTVSKLLHKGDNLIAVRVHNETPLYSRDVCPAETLPGDRLISLLFQMEIQIEHKTVCVTSDSTWIVNDMETKGWMNPKFEAERAAVTFDVMKCKNLEDSGLTGCWVHAWERGKPPLHPWGELSLFGEGISYPLPVVYTVVLPAGTAAVYRPVVKGSCECRIDGLPVTWLGDLAEVVLDGAVHQMEITVKTDGPEDGLKKPVRVKLRPVELLLMDWRMAGLNWFSGRVRYTNTIIVNEKQGSYRLDLGRVNFSAEVWMNGALAGTKIWEPYVLDVTDYVREGENEITVIAANSAAVERRHRLVDEGRALGWNRYWNEDNIDRESENLVSGLIGPVRLIAAAGISD